MKRLFNLFAAVAVSLCAMVACGENDLPETPVPPPVPSDFKNFELVVKEVTREQVTFQVTPRDNAMTYVALICEKSYFEEFSSEDGVMDDDLDWFRRMAEQQAMTLEAYLGSILKTGAFEDTEVGLQPDTEYYLYAYGLGSGGELLTEMDKLLFRTDALEMTDTTFAIELNEISFNSVKVKVTPSDPSALYFVNVFNEDRYQEFGGNEESFLAQLAYVRDYYLNKGATVEQIIANLALAGEHELIFDELLPAKKHYAYVIGVDRDFFANTQATVEEFSTQAAEEADLTFDIQFSKVDYESVLGTITPSNDTDTYICTVQQAEALSWYESEEEFINSILMDLEYWYGGVEAALRSGASELRYTGLFPESEYMVVCFGWDQAPTTGITTKTFTTEAASGDPETFTATFAVEKITHNSAEATITPSNGCHYFFDWCDVASFEEMAVELGSRDAAAAYFIEEEIDYGAEWYDGDRIGYLTDMGAILGTAFYPVKGLEPDTEYLLLAMPLDMTTGEIASQKASISDPFRTLQKVEGKASVTFEFGHFYDGSELANLDPAQFLQCTGYAVMPYKVVVDESAACWYTGFYDYDMSEWLSTDDDIYAELITWGYEVGSEYVSLNRTEGVAVMGWDITFTFLGMAEDAEGNFGQGTVETVTPTKDQVAPAEEFLEMLNAAPASLQRPSKRIPMARAEREPHGLRR